MTRLRAIHTREITDWSCCGWNMPELGQGPFSAFAEGASEGLKDVQAQRKT